MCHLLLTHNIIYEKFNYRLDLHYTIFGLSVKRWSKIYFLETPLREIVNFSYFIKGKIFAKKNQFNNICHLPAASGDFKKKSRPHITIKYSIFLSLSL